MHIKTIKPDLLIGDRSYPEGSIVEVDDPVGRRLIQSKAAVAFLPRTDVDQNLTTATLPEPPSRAAKRV